MIPQTHFLVLRSSERRVTGGGEADFTNLPVLRRAHPGLERVTALKPQNPKTHFDFTIYPQVLDPEPDTKPVGATCSFFLKKKNILQ